MDTCRYYNGATIPWNIIVQYIERLGLDKDISDAIEQVIRIMDIEYLKILDKESKKD